MRRICVIAGDARYRRALALTLSGVGAEVRTGDEDDLCAGDTLVVDVDSVESDSLLPHAFDVGCPAICISRASEVLSVLEGLPGVICLHRPFPDGALEEACGGRIASRGRTPALPTLSEDRRRALYDGREIHLTASEGALLASLLAAAGTRRSREDLAREVFGDAGAVDSVTVYMHHLRRKFETNGTRLFYAESGGYYVGTKEDAYAELTVR